MPPASDGAKYTAVSAGTDASYFLRDDGAIDRTTGGDTINGTVRGPMSAPYIAISTQTVGVSNGKGARIGPTHQYFVRNDGKVDRWKNGEITSTIEAKGDGVKYISASAGNSASYLLRDDGKVDRIGTGDKGVPGMTIEAVAGCTYVLASSGDSGASYILRSDGQFDRTVNDGVIAQSINTEQEAEKSCIVM